jgi:hypothetical protein
MAKNVYYTVQKGVRILGTESDNLVYGRANDMEIRSQLRCQRDKSVLLRTDGMFFSLSGLKVLKLFVEFSTEGDARSTWGD